MKNLPFIHLLPLDFRFVRQSNGNCITPTTRMSGAEYQGNYETKDVISECLESLNDLSAEVLTEGTGFLYGKLYKILTGADLTATGDRASRTCVSQAEHKQIMEILGFLETTYTTLDVDQFNSGTTIAFDANTKILTITESGISTDYELKMQCDETEEEITQQQNTQQQNTNDGVPDGNQETTQPAETYTNKPSCNCDGKLILLPTGSGNEPDYDFISGSLKEVTDGSGKTRLLIQVTDTNGTVKYLSFYGKTASGLWIQYNEITQAEYGNGNVIKQEIIPAETRTNLEQNQEKVVKVEKSINDLISELEASANNCDECEKNLTAAVTNLSKYEAEIKNLKDQIASNKIDATTAQSRIKELEATIKELEKELEIFSDGLFLQNKLRKECLATLQKNKAENNKQVAALKQQITEAQENAAEQQKTINETTQLIVDFSTKLFEASQAQQIARGNIKQVNDLFEQLKQANGDRSDLLTEPVKTGLTAITLTDAQVNTLRLVKELYKPYQELYEEYKDRPEYLKNYEKNVYNIANEKIQIVDVLLANKADKKQYKPIQTGNLNDLTRKQRRKRAREQNKIMRTPEAKKNYKDILSAINTLSETSFVNKNKIDEFKAKIKEKINVYKNNFIDNENQPVTNRIKRRLNALNKKLDKAYNSALGKIDQQLTKEKPRKPKTETNKKESKKNNEKPVKKNTKEKKWRKKKPKYKNIFNENVDLISYAEKKTIGEALSKNEIDIKGGRTIDLSICTDMKVEGDKVTLYAKNIPILAYKISRDEDNNIIGSNEVTDLVTESTTISNSLRIAANLMYLVTNPDAEDVGSYQKSIIEKVLSQSEDNSSALNKQMQELSDLLKVMTDINPNEDSIKGNLNLINDYLKVSLKEFGYNLTKSDTMNDIIREMLRMSGVVAADDINDLQKLIAHRAKFRLLFLDKE